jgi:hypothetical protein
VTMRDHLGRRLFVTRDPVKKQTFCDDDGPLEGTVCDKGST